MSSFTAKVLMGDSLFSKYLIQPLFNFGARFYVAFVFFKFGLQKVDDNFRVTADTIGFFKDDYKVPFLPPEIAANLAAYAELILPLFLVLGLFARPAAFALFIFNAVALYSLHTAGWANPVGNWQHVIWGVLLLVVVAYGPNKYSIDSWLSDKSNGEKSSLILKLITIAALSAGAYHLLNQYLL